MNITKFDEFMHSIGYPLPTGFNYTIEVGELKRLANLNKGKNNKNLWIKRISFNGYVVGDWATGESYYYQDDKECGHHDYKKAKEKLEQLEFNQNKKYKEIADNLKEYYETLPYIDIKHPYLLKKGISYGNVKQDDKNIVIPCYGTESFFIGEIQSIQIISPTGFKQFKKGAKSKGSCFVLNEDSTSRFIFAEGFATACSILELIQARNIIATVICVFNCNNFIPVVTRFRTIYPTSTIEIWGDRDKSGIGQAKANEVAELLSCTVKLPPLTDEQVDSGLSDWNDYVNLKGVK